MNESLGSEPQPKGSLTPPGSRSAAGRLGARLWRPAIRKTALPIAILAVALAFAVFLRATKPDIERNKVEERVWPVSAVTVEIVDVQPELNLYGEIVAGREVELRPLVAGRVVEVGANFVDGGKVRAGELLVAIDRFHYESQIAERDAQLAEARAKQAEHQAELDAERKLIGRDREQVSLRGREVKRRENLLRKGSGSQKALDDARLALSEQRQRLIAREQAIARLGARVNQQQAVVQRMAVLLARARRDLEETRLLAPFDGFLAEPATAAGKMVGTGDRLARLIDANRLEARFHVSDDEFGRLVRTGHLRGRSASVIWRTESQDFVFSARIERSSSEIRAASGGVDLFARIAQTGLDTLLRPGVFVEIRIKDLLFEKVVRLPASALHGGDTVYAMVAGRLDARKVRLVARVGNDVLVRGPLKPNEKVITTAFAEVGPGVRVDVR